MFFRILKLDLKKKKVMNILLLLFIVLASVFSASGLNNIVTVMNGTDYYFDKAEVGDYAIITTNNDEIFEVLDKEKAVKSYKYDTCILGTKNNIKIKGEKADTNFNIIFQSLENSSMKFFDKDDNVLSNIKKGEVYITGDFLEDNKLSTGDYITIDLENKKIDLKIAGVAKDAFLGSKFMGNKRFLVNKEDYKVIYDHFYKDKENGENVAPIGNKIIYVKTDNPNEISKALSEVTSVIFSGTRDMLKLCYVMDMIIAFIVLILSVCLVIVALLILKFTITFTINEEYREIGVMKAIGINNKIIRNLYIIKYLSLAIVGAIIGGVLSVPFGNMMIESTTKNMVLGNTTGFGLNIIGAVFIVIVTVLFAYIYTKKVKKASPVDAIRNGQTGERYKAKTIYKMKNSHIRLNLYMAMNDILSAPRRFITIIISLFVCLIFVLGVVITTDTMKSKNLQSTFGIECNAYFNPNDAMDMFKYPSKEEFKKGMIEKYEKIFEENNMPARLSIELLYSYKVSFNGTTYNIRCIQGVNSKADEYLYQEGIAPIKENEVAITDKVANMLDAKIGDKIKIDFGDGEQELIVTSIFQSLNNMGQLVRLNENAPDNVKNLVGSQWFQVDFKDNPSDEEINNRVKRLKEILDTEDVCNPEKFIADCIGVVDTMESVQYLLLTITIIVVILVTLLMELSFVTNEKSQIALLKAVGFKDIQIIKWHVYRFMIATIIAEILATIFVIPITKAWCNPIFGMMGAGDINFFINPMNIFLLYPGIVLGVTIITAFIASIATKKIKSSDTANIE